MLSFYSKYIRVRIKQLGLFLLCVCAYNVEALTLLSPAFPLIYLKSEQSTRLIKANPMDVFAPRRDIEKRDEQSKNISHYLLQYNVSYGGDANWKT